MFAICKHLIDGRPAQAAAMVPLSAFTDRVVVAVKEKSKMLVEDLISRDMMFEDHLLKEPGCVGDIPLRRRGVDHRLRDVVLGLERFAQVFGSGTNVAVEFAEVDVSGFTGADALHLLLDQKQN